jgi:hypothetical protein
MIERWEFGFGSLILLAVLASFLIVLAALPAPVSAAGNWFWGDFVCQVDADCPQYFGCQAYSAESGDCHCSDGDYSPEYQAHACHCPDSESLGGSVDGETLMLCHRHFASCSDDSDCSMEGLECRDGQCRIVAQIIPCSSDSDCSWGWECLDLYWLARYAECTGGSECDVSEAPGPLDEASLCSATNVCVPEGRGAPILSCTGGGGLSRSDYSEETSDAHADGDGAGEVSGTSSCSASPQTIGSLFVLCMLSVLLLAIFVWRRWNVVGVLGR